MNPQESFSLQDMELLKRGMTYAEWAEFEKQFNQKWIELLDQITYAEDK